MKNISIKFDGYWRDINKKFLPSKSGIYCVYACTYNVNAASAIIRELLYVGESEDVRNRISQHEKMRDWRKRLRTNEELLYSFGAIGSNERYQAEAAIINHHKPPCNYEYQFSFPFTTTRMYISGEKAMLEENFIVKDTRWV